MITGRDNLQLINQHIYRAQTEQEKAVRRLEALHQELNTLHLETIKRYRALAKLRLDDFQADPLVSRLDESDRVISNLLEKLQLARQALQNQIQASLSRQHELEEQRKELERGRDEAGQEIQRQLEEARKGITGTEAYRRQKERAETAEAVAQQAEDKATQTEKDRLDKSKPYEADDLFTYLWKRGYLTPQYQAGWFARRMDNWVAKHIDYQRNRSNYYMLQELPIRLREHAVKARQTAQLEAQALQTMEREATEAAGIPGLQARMQEAEKKLQEHDALIAAEESRHRQLLEQQTDFNEGRDASSRRIVELQIAALQREELAELLREARATPRPEDDALVAQLQQMQQQRKQVETEIQSTNGFLQQQQRSLDELEELRRRYRHNGYDSYNSSFSGGFALGALLGQMLEGLLNSEGVWREIGRHHQRRGPSGDWGGSGRGFEGSDDERRGFGGGDFRTGGGF